ncbi:MAG TPA: AAA family ATPase [Candidatus Bipolaricaulota bacterium]|nr:AAA family ATPase [Candidatus Bipolaricaulota bacterium]
MYLSKIEIQGFKSFAKKTVLEFPEKSHKDKAANSVTAIVGPNGSGKSNISDAVRWVLGEQSLKLLRGKKSEDVIFSGSPSLARQGFAEVSLFLNNEDKKLPIDYSEVAITRRVYRDGEGEYLINKNKVRLFDILMLLAKANFGQKSYSIIGQGMVDYVINISPTERKEFFDEATGIKQYQIKRDQSVNKLRRSRENLDQSNGILAELEPRLKSLTRQVKKLEKRKELEAALKDLQEKYYGYLWKDLSGKRKNYNREYQVQEKVRAEAAAELGELQRQLAELARQESRKDLFYNLQKEYNKLQAEKNQMLGDLTVLKGKSNLEYSKLGKQNISWMEEKKEEVLSRINEVSESLSHLQTKLEHQRGMLAEKQDCYQEVLKNITLFSNNLEAAQNDLAKIKGRGGQGFSSNQQAVAAILRQQNHLKGIFGSVSQLGKVDEKYQIALEAASGGRLGSIVVKDEDAAIRCINYLKENRLGIATFLPLTKINPFESRSDHKNILAERGAIAKAIDLVSFDPQFKKIFSYVLGDTIVVDEMNSAKSIGFGAVRMVTLDGDLVEKAGSIRGGFRRIREAVFSFGAKAAIAEISQETKMQEIETLKNKLNNSSREKEILINEINDLKVNIEVNDTKEKGLKNDLGGLSVEKRKVVMELEENKLSPKDQPKFLVEVSRQKKELEDRLQSLEKKILVSKEKMDRFNLEEEKKTAQVFKLQEEMQKKQAEVNEITDKVNQAKIMLAKLEAKAEDLSREIGQELGDSINPDNLPEPKGQLNIDQLWHEIGKIKHDLDLIGGIDPEIVGEYSEVKERYEFLSGQLKDLEKAIADLEQIIIELDKVIRGQFESSFKKINKSFSEYFQKIFQGGKAKLSLVQSEESSKDEKIPQIEGQVVEEPVEKEYFDKKYKPVNQGIDIMVSPPNKKIVHITALSGGERTMTSIALLCAIIDSNPSPFVVMDEVDAALDEANSERFANIINELSYKTQFLVITHNRVVMHSADILYGVSMGDDGVSRVLSIDLKEAEKIEAK